MDAGAIDFLNVLLSGSAANVALASNQVGVPSDNTAPLTNTLTWQGI